MCVCNPMPHCPTAAASPNIHSPTACSFEQHPTCRLASCCPADFQPCIGNQHCQHQHHHHYHADQRRHLQNPTAATVVAGCNVAALSCKGLTFGDDAWGALASGNKIQALKCDHCEQLAGNMHAAKQCLMAAGMWSRLKISRQTNEIHVSSGSPSGTAYWHDYGMAHFQSIE